jgi:pimeloyl-ACP methyl ester carboxylesterase
MATRPELVLVHGAWHGAWAWSRLLPVLEQRGWTASAVDLPSAGSTAGLGADCDVLRGVLEASSAPKVVVGHSYGGTVVTQGAAGVDSVVGLAYVCAARPDVGDVVWTDPRSPDEVPYWIRVDVEDEAIHALHSETILYNDCAPDVVADAQARLKPQSLASFLEPVTAAAWRERPSAYLICERDNCVPAAAQEGLADGCGHVERVDAGHSPFFSRPEDVEAFLDRAVATF